VGSLIIENVKKAFGPVEVLKGINLEVNDGEFVVFVGPSGCGKSTLLRVIAGLEDSTSGRVVIDGADVSATPPAKRAKVTWIPADRMHLTIRFIGEVDDDQASMVREVLEDPLAIVPFSLTLCGAGTFPKSGTPRVIWLGVTEGREQLLEVEREITARLGPLGIPEEDRAYSPHLTVARVRDPAGLKSGPLLDGLTDHRVGWCRVVEKKVKHGDSNFVDQTKERHKGVISSIRHQFQLMKPENLTRVANELDGEEFDLNAVIDYVIDRRADGQQSERIYTKRLRRRRDVAVSFLLDQSSSTARTIGRHPLQPYTRPGRRIIEIEKEGLVLMSEALEAVGDVYSINGFTSEGRRNVKFYVVKDFDEKYGDEVKRRIGGINYQNNTRLGAAIRHATAKLAKQDARTRLLIVLSDGRPYDHDYGDARYAREDTREALRQAKNEGITPFCITIDRESEAELRDLYGEVGYTIIDDVLSLPERLPGIYRRLTT